MYKTFPLIKQRHQVRYVRSYGKVFDLIEQTTRYEIGMNGELTSSTLSRKRKQEVGRANKMPNTI